MSYVFFIFLSLWLKFTQNYYQTICNMTVAWEFIRCKTQAETPEDITALQWPKYRHGRNLRHVYVSGPSGGDASGSHAAAINNMAKAALHCEH